MKKTYTPFTSKAWILTVLLNWKEYRYLLIILITHLNANVLPDYDPLCDFLKSYSANITPLDNPEQNEYFSQKVPKIIHRIWFGDALKLNQSHSPNKIWEYYANIFDYEYRFWSEKDDPFLRSFMETRNFDLMVLLRNIGDYWGASDILRYEILKKFGGIYVDCDFSPPTSVNSFFDFSEIIPFRGLTLMLEYLSRDIGNYSALFVANGFIASPPNHPIVCSFVEQVYQNAMNWYQYNYCNALYATGPMFVNKVLSGCFSVVSVVYLAPFMGDPFVNR